MKFHVIVGRVKNRAIAGVFPINTRVERSAGKISIATSMNVSVCVTQGLAGRAHGRRQSITPPDAHAGGPILTRQLFEQNAPIRCLLVIKFATDSSHATIIVSHYATRIVVRLARSL